MRTTALVVAVAAFFALAACGRSNDNTSQRGNTPTTAATTPMNSGKMPMAQASGMGMIASGRGTVTDKDDQAGSITIKHGPVAAANWSAMTMTFRADPTLREKVAVGDQVAFDFRTTGEGGQITSIASK